jgi:hypothetical protein
MELHAIPRDGESVRTESIGGGFHDGQCRSGCDGGIGRGAAAAKHVKADLGCQWLAGCHDMLSKDRHAAAWKCPAW